MTLETSGPIAIQARIAAIQGQFAQPAVGTSKSGAGSTGSTGSTGSGTAGSDFASALAKLAPGALDAASGSASGSTWDAISGAGAASATGAGGGTGAAVSGDQIVADARRYLGVPYVWGGTTPKGFDCSGLVQQVYKDLGIQLPRVSQDQAHVGTEVPSLAQAKPGDLVCFGTPADHIGIYIGGHKMIVAPKAGDVVKVEDVYRTPSTIRRVLPLAAGSESASGSAASSSPAMAAAPAAYQSLFEQAGQRYGVAPDLLAAVAQTESGFNPGAVSGAGARGLMQLMPGTAAGLHVDPTNPAQAVDGAARLLARNMRTFGSTSLALAAYNAGPGAVTRYHGIPPYAETRSYVTKVLAAAGMKS